MADTALRAPAGATRPAAAGPDLAGALARPLGWAALLAMLAALGAIFVYAPAERVQGDVQRIFYAHLSLAWLAYLAFFVVFVASILFLWRKQGRWDHLAHASAELGVVFTTLVIATGMLWGRPVWGVWWTWDARLTTTLVLWFLYVAYLMLRSYVADPQRARRFAAVAGIVAFVDVPIVHLSVTWWRSLHPEPTVVSTAGGSMAPEMLHTLLLTLLAFTLLYAYLLLQRVWLQQLRDELARLRHLAALKG